MRNISSASRRGYQCKFFSSCSFNLRKEFLVRASARSPLWDSCARRNLYQRIIEIFSVIPGRKNNKNLNKVYEKYFFYETNRENNEGKAFWLMGIVQQLCQSNKNVSVK